MFLLLAFSFLSVPLAAQTKESPLVFSRVTVIDVVSGRATPDMTVVVEGPRITAVGKSGRVKLPRGAQTIDDSGTYLIPGLWDMHVHSLFEGRYDWFFPMLIANGITGVRELGNDLPFERLNQIRREISERKTLTGWRAKCTWRSWMKPNGRRCRLPVSRRNGLATLVRGGAEE